MRHPFTAWTPRSRIRYHTLTKLARTLFGTATTRKTQPVGSRFRPRLECLEERAVPAAVTTFAQLKTAIDNANANPDANTIEIAANTTITLTAKLPVIKYSLTIKGAGNTSIIQGEGDAANPTPDPVPGRLFTAIAEGNSINLILQDLVLARGYASGAGIDGRGGAVFSDNANLTIEGVRFEGNRASQQGGAIYVERQHTSVQVEECQFVSNRAESRGGAIATWGYINSVHTLFTSNTSMGDGGALYLYRHELALPHRIADTIFQFNQAKEDGGAIFVFGSASVVVSNSGFNDNKAGQLPGSTSGRGGAIYAQAGMLDVLDSTFINNLSKTNGGALFVGADCDAMVLRSSFQNNRSGTPLTDNSVFISTGGSYSEDGSNIYLDAIPVWE
jgi:predicted outer membrane repeat protein